MHTMMCAYMWCIYCISTHLAAYQFKPGIARVPVYLMVYLLAGENRGDLTNHAIDGTHRSKLHLFLDID